MGNTINKLICGNTKFSLLFYPPATHFADDETDDDDDGGACLPLANVRMVGIAGCKGAGKDTYADAIIAKLHAHKDGPLVERYQFASAAKAIIMDHFGVTAEFIEIWKRRDNNPPGFMRPMRELLQHVGDLRTFQPNVWIDATFPMTAATPAIQPYKVRDESLIIVTDVRYPNECQAIHERGGIVVLVGRESKQPSSQASKQPSSHSSEMFFKDLSRYMLDNTRAPIVVMESLDLAKAPSSARHVDYFVRNDNLEKLSEAAEAISRSLLAR